MFGLQCAVAVLCLIVLPFTEASPTSNQKVEIVKSPCTIGTTASDGTISYSTETARFVITGYAFRH